MRFLVSAAACALALAGPANAAGFTDPFSSYIAFGDSLTDDGKFGMQAPPSFGGRFSNGITYAEHIAQDFADDGKFTLNLALGGATAELDNETAYPDPGAVAGISTFQAQIGTFAATAGLGAPIGDNPLFTVLFGANDLLQDIGESQTIGADAATAVTDGILAINALNPTDYTSFAVANLPDLSQTPLFSGTLAAPLAQATSDQFNQTLAANIALLRNAGLEIFEVDLAGFFQSVLDNPGDLGIVNTTDACTPSLQIIIIVGNCSFDLQQSAFDLALADQFLFVDPVHPNRVAQEAFAQVVRDSVSAVPVPAGLPLLLAGVAAIGLLRVRSKA
ncbi:MAG: SGNH/GDSL hydrolase family protein [Pseudomonadota bacterium]